MGATRTKVDRKAAVEAQALEAVRQLLTELGASRGLEELHARGASAHLERELGLGSLERVELMLRLGNACAVRLPEQVMAEANTVGDLVNAILQQERGGAPPTEASRATFEIGEAVAAKGADGRPSVRPELERQVRAAESLTEILRLRGLGEPERAHLHLYEGDEARTITFGELYERASAAAQDLARRGLEPGQTVAIMLPTCAEFYASFAGVLLAGGIPVPIYPPFRADRIAEYATRQANILRNAEARFLITWRQAEHLARMLQPNVPSLREVLNGERLCASADAGRSDTVNDAPGTDVTNAQSKKWRPVEALAYHARGEDIAFLQYTSGSTGDPKGVVLTHANLLANIRSMIAGAEVVPEDVAVSWLPLYHDMGLIGMWLAPLFAGIPVAVMSPTAFLTRPEMWLWAIHRRKATLSPAPNFAYELCVRKIADKDIEGLDLSHWRAALNGAEPVHAATLEKFIARFERYGFRREAMLPVYGLAENSLAISAPQPGFGYRVDRIQRSTFESSRRAVPQMGGSGATLDFVGAGKPLADVEVKIVDDDRKEVGERIEGHLWFRGPSATSGYYKNESATRELIRDDGWLDSGDLAYCANGELFITGRAKDIIIKAGRNLYPHEIEALAGRIAGVRQGCVVAFAAPDERQGTEKFVIAAEIRDAAEAKRISSEIASAMQETMGQPPDVIELLPPQSIPKTSSGKLRRSETRRLYLEGKLGKKQQAQWVQIARLGVRAAWPRAWAILRRGTLKTAEFVYGAYALAVCAIVVPILWMLLAVTRNRDRAARMIRAASRLTLRCALMPMQIEGEELLETLVESGPWIFAPNHSSYLDIIVALAVLPASVRFVVKADAVQIPFFGLMVRRSGQYRFDRDDPAARVRQSEEVDAALRRGESVVVYPEGTFTPLTGIRPFQLGAFKAAVDTQRPICPVAISGARQILRDKTYLPKFGRLSVTAGPLVEPKTVGRDDWQEMVRLRDEVREIIAKNVGEQLL